MLLQFGFYHRWVDLMIFCVATVRYTSNGFEIGHIIPQRGLRQGDPLSPYLFFIFLEDLTSFLQYVVHMGKLHDIKVARSAPSIYHLCR